MIDAMHDLLFMQASLKPARPCRTRVGEDTVSIERIELERGIYRRLLDLAPGQDAASVLEDVLRMVVSITGASCGFVQSVSFDGAVSQVATAMADESMNNVLSAISTGIIGEALKRGEVVRTTSAMLDPRFKSNASVRRGAIQAVVCVPVAGDRGVIYLQGPRPFDDEALQIIERVGQSFEPLIARRALDNNTDDPTASWRARLSIGQVVGRSEAMARVLKHVALFAPQPLTVLLTGPTGTGKSFIAQAIHDNSRCADGPFVSINCAALPAELAESELFGAEPGAHSTATRRVLGKVDAAAGGTLFLDEIGELPTTVQAKLLELAQSGRYHALGSTRERTSTARIVAATNVDLVEAMAEGRFRSDLYHRLSGFVIAVPALSDRRSDIPLLADALLQRACASMQIPRLRLSSAAAVALATRPWVGNVRELDNAVRRAAVFASSEGGTEVQRHHFDADPGTANEALSYGEATRSFQRQLLADTLDAVDGNVVQASQRLGLAKSYVYALIKEYGLRS